MLQIMKSVQTDALPFKKLFFLYREVDELAPWTIFDFKFIIELLIFHVLLRLVLGLNSF